MSKMYNHFNEIPDAIHTPNDYRETHDVKLYQT